MKHLLLALCTLTMVLNACKSTESMVGIQPKFGSISLPAKGELRLWQNTNHPAFTITLTNEATNQSCELYIVNKLGNEKWINPSLMPRKSITLTISKNGHLFFKNFNPNSLKINYKIKE